MLCQSAMESKPSLAKCRASIFNVMASFQTWSQTQPQQQTTLSISDLSMEVCVNLTALVKKAVRLLQIYGPELWINFFKLPIINTLILVQSFWTNWNSEAQLASLLIKWSHFSFSFPGFNSIYQYQNYILLITQDLLKPATFPLMY